MSPYSTHVCGIRVWIPRLSWLSRAGVWKSEKAASRGRLGTQIIIPDKTQGGACPHIYGLQQTHTITSLHIRYKKKTELHFKWPKG